MYIVHLFSRYIAIVHPIQAHLWCSRKRTIIAIACIWPCAMIFGLPTVLFNKVVTPFKNAPVDICRIVFPEPHVSYMTAFKITEFLLFFLVPVVVQIVLYSIISKHLFIDSKTLYKKKLTNLDGVPKLRDGETIRMRKGVVKMLISIVVIYVISYSPAQVPLFYNLFSTTGPFQQKWVFLVLVMVLGYINSACNPILYSVFSQKFRKKFLCIFRNCRKQGPESNRETGGTYSTYQLRHTSRHSNSSYIVHYKNIQVQRNSNSMST